MGSRFPYRVRELRAGRHERVLELPQAPYSEPSLICGYGETALGPIIVYFLLSEPRPLSVSVDLPLVEVRRAQATQSDGRCNP